MAFGGYQFEGQIQIEPVQTVIGTARTGASIAAIAASKSATGLTLGLSSLAWTGIGLALAAIGAVFSVVRSSIAKSKAKEKAKRARIAAYNQLGIGLIEDVYGMQIPGWEFPVDPTIPSKYYQLGVLFYVWSKDENEETKKKSGEKLINWLKSEGLEPTRFMGAENVPPGGSLVYEKDYVAEPEKFLVANEALKAIGYTSDQFENLPFKWFIRFFDIVMWIPKAYHELQAQMVKADLEYHLSAGGLDPRVMWKTVLPSETIPQTVYEITVEPEVKAVKLQSDTEKLLSVVTPSNVEEKTGISEGGISIAGFTVPPLLILIGAMVFLFAKEG